MGKTDPVVKSVIALQIPLIEFDNVDGYRYTVDLSKFKSVYCFPEKQEDWNGVFQMDGDRVVWKNRFEIHVDQAVANTIKKEKLKESVTS